MAEMIEQQLRTSGVPGEQMWNLLDGNTPANADPKHVAYMRELSDNHTDPLRRERLEQSIEAIAGPRPKTGA
jgi:hypothetical protein